MQKFIDIQVRSRPDAKKFFCDLPWAAISISTDPSNFPELQTENRVGLLRLSFWDSDGYTISYEETEYLFNKNYADQIIDFVDEMFPKIETLLVHCEMGVSRSPAIAAAISNHFWGKNAESIYFKKHTPNMFVYRTILHAYNEKSNQ